MKLGVVLILLLYNRHCRRLLLHFVTNFINLFTINFGRIYVRHFADVIKSSRKLSKRMRQFIKNSRNVDTYLTANPETKSHLRQNPPHQWPTASSH